MIIIAHLDMDAFFAAIEERENPQFRGLGVIVGADPKNGVGRGVVSTANYQARKYGIHSAMPISQAWRLAQEASKRGEPKSVFLPVNMVYYAEVSEKIFAIIQKFVPMVEQTSIDEAYLDLSFCEIDSSLKSSLRSVYFSAHVSNTNQSDEPARKTHLPANFNLEAINVSYQKARNLIIKIKELIEKQEHLTAKVGIGPNKLIAKMASSKCKPSELNIILPQNVNSFLEPLSVRDIPGIGPKTEVFFNERKIYKVTDLKKVSPGDLINWLGKWGEDIYRKARGIDNSPLEIEKAIKSISEQETFMIDTLNAQFLLEHLKVLSERVYERFDHEEFSGFKTVSITVRFFDFSTKTRAHSLKDYSNSSSVLYNEALKLFLPFLDARENYQRRLIRLIGVGIENFSKQTQAAA